MHAKVYTRTLKIPMHLHYKNRVKNAKVAIDKWCYSFKEGPGPCDQTQLREERHPSRALDAAQVCRCWEAEHIPVNHGLKVATE